MKHVVLSGDNAGETRDVRPLSIDELKRLSYGDRVLVVTGYHGKRDNVTGIVHCKVNGAPKTWKTRPDDVTVPVKYGLYEYARIEYQNGAMVDDNLYIVKQV